MAVRFLEHYQVTHNGFDLISFNMTEAEIHDLRGVTVGANMHFRVCRSPAP